MIKARNEENNSQILTLIHNSYIIHQSINALISMGYP